MLRRAGRISDIAQFIEKAEKACQRSNMAGLSFCKGLHHRYCGDAIEALKALNIARFDNFYGQSARINMIEIYLNPANEMIFSSQGDTGYATTEQNIQMARELIEDLQKTGVDTSILDCNALISTKQKSELELAAKTLQNLLAKNKDYVPALVAMGLCKFIQKKSSDARNYLKTVVKNDF